MDGENFRVFFSKLGPGLFIERAERVHGLPLRGFEARLLFMGGVRMPGGSLLRAEKDDFSGGKALRDGKP